MTFFKKIIWVIFCSLPIVFITICYSLVIGRFASTIISHEILDGVLLQFGLGLASILVLTLLYLPLNILQLFLIIFLTFKNQAKFPKKTFKTLFYITIILLILTIFLLIPYISITFFKNYHFSEFWYNKMGILIYFLDIIVPFGQLFFIYIFWKFWKIWFGNEVITDSKP
jgi:hypothetical protein